MNSTNSFSNFLFKSLFFAFFLIFLSLFPPNAPSFINQTLFTHLWDLLHLLFIGIAVSYGLLSRKTLDLDARTSSSIDYLQRCESIFFDSGEYSCGYDKENVYLLDESNICYGSLGLPVRSLKSVADRTGSSNRSGSSYCFTSSFRDFDESRKRKFGDLGPVNLEEKFDESEMCRSYFRPLAVDDIQFESPKSADSGIRMPSSFPSHSISERMEISPSYFRPPVVDEFQLESFKLQSSFLSQTSSMEELWNSDMEELGMSEMGYDTSPSHFNPPSDLESSSTSQPSSIPSSPHSTSTKLPSPMEMRDNVPNVTRPSFIDPNLKKAEESKNMSFRRSFPPASTSPKTRMEYASDAMPTSLLKASAGGKSVRRIRANGYIGNKCNEVGEVEKIGKIGAQVRKNHDISNSQQHTNLPQNQNSGKQKRNENFRERSDKEFTYGAIDVRADLNEVDKKADEFIAKFREQIRLQKIASMEGSSI